MMATKATTLRGITMAKANSVTGNSFLALDGPSATTVTKLVICFLA